MFRGSGDVLGLRVPGFDEDLNFFSSLLLKEAVVEVFLDLSEILNTALFFNLGNLSMQAGGRCSGAGTVGENMDFGEADLLYHVAGFEEFGFCFSGKSNNDIGGQGNSGKGFLGSPAPFEILFDRSRTVHALMDGGGAALHGKMEVGADFF